MSEKETEIWWDGVREETELEKPRGHLCLSSPARLSVRGCFRLFRRQRDTARQMWGMTAATGWYVDGWRGDKSRKWSAFCLQRRKRWRRQRSGEGDRRRECETDVFPLGGRDEFAPSRNVIFSPHMCFFNSYALFSSVQNKNYKRISTLGWLAV